MNRVWMTRAIALGATLAFAIGVMWYYHFRPTIGAVVLVAGWSVLIGAGWLLARAAATFDLRISDPVFEAPETTRRQALEQEKKGLLKAIKELDFEKAMGKLDERDAAEIIARYRARAVEILRELEGFDPDAPSDADRGYRGGPGDKVYRGMIEREIAKRLSKAGIEAPVRTEAKTEPKAKTESAPGPAVAATDTASVTEAVSEAATDSVTETDTATVTEAVTATVPATATAPAPASTTTAPTPSPAAAGVGGSLSRGSDTAPTCFTCATINDPDAVFCKKCGSKIGASA